MKYGIYAIPYGDTFAFIPAIYQQGIYCEVAPLFWKYQYLMKDKRKKIIIEYPTQEDFWRLCMNDQIVTDTMYLFSDINKWMEWRKNNPTTDARIYLKENGYYNMLES